MKRNILLYGLISGVSLVSLFDIYLAILLNTNIQVGRSFNAIAIGYLSQIISFSFIFFGIKRYRDNQNGGEITFYKALMMAVLVFLISSTVFVIVWAIEFHFFLSDLYDEATAREIKAIIPVFKSKIMLENRIHEIQMNDFNYKHNILYFIKKTYFQFLPIGLLASLMSAAILKKRNVLDVKLDEEKRF